MQGIATLGLNRFSSDWKRKWGIYCIVNLVNSKVYVGSSTCLKLRWLSHRRELNLGTHRNDHLQKSWNKYGESNFCIEVLEIYDGKNLKELSDKENNWIAVFDSLNRNKGYNIDLSGNLHFISEETKKKISKSNTGHRHTEETKKRISQMKTGVKHTDESRKNMSIAVRKRNSSGWKPSQESVQRSAEKRKGQKRTLETRRKLSRISKENSKNRRIVKMLDIDSNYIRNFNSISAAALFLNIPLRKGCNSHIVDAAAGRKKSAYGYKWSYEKR